MNQVVQCGLRSLPWCWKSLASMSKAGTHMFCELVASLVAPHPTPPNPLPTHTHIHTHTLWTDPLLWLLHTHTHCELTHFSGCFTHTHTVNWPTSLVASHTHTVNWPTSLVARSMENVLPLTSPCIDSPPGDLPQCPCSVTHVLLVTTCAVSCTDSCREHAGRGSVWQKLCQINGWVRFVLNVF